MLKKVALGFMLTLVVVSLFGCGMSTMGLVEENMSELTKVYYMAENNDFYCTLSSGVREKNYLMNGESGEVTDFALLTIVPNQNVSGSLIKAHVKIDGVESEVELEINGLNHNFMVDLEKAFSGNEVVEVTYEGVGLVLENVSNDFSVDYNKAIEIACKEMNEQIVAKKKFSNLNAECYLRVLDKKANQFDSVFWCFTVLNVDNESYSIVLSAEDGTVLAKSE